MLPEEDFEVTHLLAQMKLKTKLTAFIKSYSQDGISPAAL